MLSFLALWNATQSSFDFEGRGKCFRCSTWHKLVTHRYNLRKWQKRLKSWYEHISTKTKHGVQTENSEMLAHTWFDGTAAPWLIIKTNTKEIHNRIEEELKNVNLNEVDDTDVQDFLVDRQRKPKKSAIVGPLLVDFLSSSCNTTKYNFLMTFQRIFVYVIL